MPAPNLVGFHRLLAHFAAAPWGEALPGLSLALSSEGEEWTAGFGFANLNTGRPCLPETIYRVGSITKTLTAIMLLQLHEAGILALDDPIEERLPDLPWPPTWLGRRPITFRHLAMHTSGLPFEAPGDHLTTLQYPDFEELLRSLRGTPLLFTPGTNCEYSNTGYAILGTILALLARQRYDEHIQDRVLKPLGMAGSGFAPTPQACARLAVGYLPRQAGAWLPAPDPNLRAFLPAAGLYSTVTDLVRYLAFHLGAGGTDVLAPAAVLEMRRPGPFGRSLGWEHARFGGFDVFGLAGRTFGWSADVRFIPALHVALAVAGNTRVDLRDITDALVEELAAT